MKITLPRGQSLIHAGDLHAAPRRQLGHTRQSLIHAATNVLPLKDNLASTMLGPQLEEGENLNTEAPGTGRTPSGGPSALAGQTQGGPSPAFVKENIDVLRTMINEIDNRGQEKVTPRKLFNDGLGGAGSENSQISPSAEEVGGYSSDGSSRSRSRVRASRRKSSSDSGYDTVSDSGLEYLSMPYRQRKPMPFTYRITRFRYHRRAKLPPNVRVYEGNRDLEDYLSIFSAAAEQEEWPMPSVDGFEELSNKFLEEFSQQKRYDKDPTEIHGIKRNPNEGLQAFMDRFKAESANIKGVPPVESGHSLGERQPQTRPKPSGLLDGKRVLVRPAGRKTKMGLETEVTEVGEGRNMRTCAPYARREGFTPLTKTPKEILVMNNVNFPPPPPMEGTQEKQNMNNGLRKIGSSGERHQARRPEGKGSAKGKKKVINMVRSQGYRKRPYERIEHWMDNTIAFPSVPRYQLMDFLVVVDALIEGFRVKRIHVDGGSSSEAMYKHCIRNLSYRTRSRLKESRVPLVGFLGEVSYPLGVIDLEVTIGECEKTRTVIMEFAVVKSPSPYNVLLGRTGMRSLEAVASTIHSMIKFPTSNGIATIATTRETLRECGKIEEAQALSRHARVTDPTPMQTSSEVINPKVLLAPVETRPRRTGKEPMQLDDMEERRQLDKGRKPPKSGVKEKIEVNDNYPEQLVTIRGGLSAECRHALIHTLRKNVDVFAWIPSDMTGIPKAITEHSLNTYPHIEPKAQKKRSLAPRQEEGDPNKACPKDLYPLPKINWKIKSLMGFQYKCFLDAYKGHHQIQMTKKDEEKTDFHTEEGVFCYMKMTFGLKNAGATYQRLVDSAFKERIREGKFLGYIVTLEEIRANPEKAKAVMDMPSPKTLKQMQSLSGKLAALNCFLSKSAERSLPFLDTLKKCTNKKDFRWTEAAEAAFLEMKKLVSELPTLTTPKKGETLMIYLAAANEAVSAVLLTERNRRKMPIHFVNRSLQGAETNYASMEKLALALVHAARRLRRYFQAHPIKVITDSPIGQVLNNSGASRRLAKWAVELGAYGITYVPRVAVKGQVLVDFLADTPTEINATPEMANNPRVEDIPESSNAREDLTPGPRYEALLAGLWIAKEMQVKDIHAFMDSKLVASQVEGFRITHIPRAENRKADALSKLAAVQFDHLSKEVLV
ncbi:reverse transcriptase domain-containing protein [Tanacetum coccineum]